MYVYACYGQAKNAKLPCALPRGEYDGRFKCGTPGVGYIQGKSPGVILVMAMKKKDFASPGPPGGVIKKVWMIYPVTYGTVQLSLPCTGSHMVLLDALGELSR